MTKPWIACTLFVISAVFGGSWVVAHAGPAAQQAAATCKCGCGGTPRPACAHSCNGTPCTGGAITNSRIIVGEVVEGAPATLSVLAPSGGALKGFVVDLGGGQRVTTDEHGQGTFTPNGHGAIKANIDGVTATTIAVLSGTAASSAESRIPRFATVGLEMPLTQAGQFDGHAENTQAFVGNIACPVLFEAPHQAIISVPATTPIGPTQLRVIDQGRTVERPIQLVRFTMEAEKTNLDKGEKSPGKVVIDGATSSLVGGVVRIENVSTDIITMQLPGDKAIDKLEKRIDAGMIKDGRIEIPMMIEGRRRGPFSVVGGLFDPQGMASAKCSCGCGGTPRPACAHSCGGNSCTGTTIKR